MEAGLCFTPGMPALHCLRCTPLRPPLLRLAAAALALLHPILPPACAAAPPPARPNAVPGIVINHRPASTQQYLGSPSIVVLTNGACVVSHDFFGPGTTRDRTEVFVSADRGTSWSGRAVLQGQWWSTLFRHRSALYLMGTSRENGFAVVRRSTDDGRPTRNAPATPWR